MKIELARFGPEKDSTNIHKAPTEGRGGSTVAERLQVRGKFLFLGEQKFFAKGVTYGTFRPASDGTAFPSPDLVERDFEMMARAGLNSVRVYTVPPRWLLDRAQRHGLRVAVGIPWEQHIAFLNDRRRVAQIVARVRNAATSCAQHPAVLCYTIGNEIPSSVVRWHGPRAIEQFLSLLYRTVKAEDPEGLVTYVNYPSTEYLSIPFLDFISFNVYLESEQRFSAYLARLHNLAGERPLVMGEIGLDSRRNGEVQQARTLEWQLSTAFQSGCAGAFVFAWTDDWHRGGHDIEDWDFGITTRDRSPKPALAAVSGALHAIPAGRQPELPRISVIVCSYNGAASIGETLAALGRLRYANFEVIVVDDGSTDETSSIAANHNVTVIRTENRGLSSARNTGLEYASGDMVAYVDDDAFPDEDWLTFLALGFAKSDHAGIGGPNIIPPSDGFLAQCVSNAPGGPVHVLLTDEVAEHIPGCNMAFKRDRLLAIGGFDERFRVAGDDVDVCWRLQDAGWTLGFSPGAMVWHHRRNSVRRYWKQQRGYAKAEAMLAAKWPTKYNAAGHSVWHGRLYGRGIVDSIFILPRVYYGVWGTALFQSVYQRSPGPISSLPLMPEWYLLLVITGGLTLLGLIWAPLLWLVPVVVAGVAATLVQAVLGGARSVLHSRPRSRLGGFVQKSVVVGLHLIQPVARLIGRVQHGLGPWRWLGWSSHCSPDPNEWAIWEEQWQEPTSKMLAIERALAQSSNVAVRKGSDFDRWDLTVRGGLFGSIRVAGMVEEHGGGKQLFRLRAWPKVPGIAVALIIVFAVIAAAAASDGAWIAALPLFTIAMIITAFAYCDCAVSMKAWSDTLARFGITATSSWSSPVRSAWLRLAQRDSRLAGSSARNG